MTAAFQLRTSGPAHHGQSRFFACPRAQRHAPRCRNSRPAKRVAGQKTAPGNFFRTPPKTRPEIAPQTLGTHQENYLWAYDFALGCAVAPNSGGLASPNSPGGLWVPNGLNDLLHGQTVLPGLPVAVAGGTVVVNQRTVTGLQMGTSDGGTVSASGVRMTITYYNNSGQSYNWSQVVTSDTLPHPTGTPPYSDGFGVLGTYYPGSQLQNANPPGAAIFRDRPVDTGPGSVSFTTQPVNPSNPSQGSPFTISWGFTYTNSNGRPVITPAPITVIPPGGG